MKEKLNFTTGTKRIMALALVVVLCLAMVPIASFASTDEDGYCTQCGVYLEDGFECVVDELGHSELICGVEEHEASEVCEEESCENYGEACEGHKHSGECYELVKTTYVHNIISSTYSEPTDEPTVKPHDEELDEEQTYTVTYHVNADNVQGSIPYDSNKYAIGDAATVLDGSGLNYWGYLADDEVPHTANLHFVGWNTSINGDDAFYLAGDVIYIEGSVDLYAMFAEEGDMQTLAITTFAKQRSARVLLSSTEEVAGDLIIKKDATIAESTDMEEGIWEWDITLTLRGLDLITSSDVVLLMDTSSSMSSNNSPRMTNAKKAAAEFIDKLIPESGEGNTKIAIVPFSTNVGTVTGFTNNTTTLNSAINALSTVQYTNIQGAIIQAQSLLADSNANHKYIVLLGDGEANRSMNVTSVTGTGVTYNHSGSSHNWVYNINTIEMTFGSTVVQNGNANTGYAIQCNNSGTKHTGYFPDSDATPTIYQARLAKTSGIEFYSIALSAGTGKPTLEACSSGSGYYYAVDNENDLTGLSDAYKEIAGKIAYAASNAVVTDPMGAMFDLVGKNGMITGVGIDDITVSHGLASFNTDTETITWAIGTIEENGGSYTMTYRVRIDTDLANNDTMYPTNKETYVNYTDAWGNKDASKEFIVPLVGYPAVGTIRVNVYTLSEGGYPLTLQGLQAYRTADIAIEDTWLVENTSWDKIDPDQKYALPFGNYTVTAPETINVNGDTYYLVAGNANNLGNTSPELVTVDASHITPEVYFAYQKTTEANYTVEHWFQNINNDNYTKDSADDTMVGMIGTYTEANPRTVTGFTAKTFAQEKINADGSTVIKIYYDRIQKKVRYQYTGDIIPSDATSLTVAPYAETSYKYGATVIVADNATAQGYVFSGWSEKNATFTMPADDVVITGYWIPADDTAYKVEHYFQNIADDYYTKDSNDDNLTGTTGDYTQAVAREVTGFTAKTFAQEKINAGGSTVIKIYYDRIVLKVEYKYEGVTPTVMSPLPPEASYKYGDTVEIAANPTTDEAFEFNGWDRTQSFVIVENTIITGTWSAQYSVEYRWHATNKPTNDELTAYWSNNLPNSLLPVGSTTVTEGTLVDVDYNMYAVGTEVLGTYGGFNGTWKFLGWKSVDTNPNLDFEDASFNMPNDDVTIIGEWEFVKSADYLDVVKRISGLEAAPEGFTITLKYDDASGTPVVDNRSITIGESIAPENADYIEYKWSFVLPASVAFTVEESSYLVSGYSWSSKASFDNDELASDVDTWSVEAEQFGEEGSTFYIENTYTNFSVRYTLVGEVPTNFDYSNMPLTANYSGGEPNIAIADNLDDVLVYLGETLITKYTFNGWVLITPEKLDTAVDGTFTMPNEDVVFQGSWSKESYNLVVEGFSRYYNGLSENVRVTSEIDEGFTLFYSLTGDDNNWVTRDKFADFVNVTRNAAGTNAPITVYVKSQNEDASIISYGSATVLIQPITLVLTAESEWYNYNGSTRSVTTYTMNGTMPNGEYLTAYAYGAGAGARYSTTRYDVLFYTGSNGSRSIVTNANAATIYYANGTVAPTDNYIITTNTGTLTIYGGTTTTTTTPTPTPTTTTAVERAAVADPPAVQNIPDTSVPLAAAPIPADELNIADEAVPLGPLTGDLSPILLLLCVLLVSGVAIIITARKRLGKNS